MIILNLAFLILNSILLIKLPPTGKSDDFPRSPPTRGDGLCL